MTFSWAPIQDLRRHEDWVPTHYIFPSNLNCMNTRISLSPNPKCAFVVVAEVKQWLTMVTPVVT